MRFCGIIPARYTSTRFPGKPLAAVFGKPMIQRVYENSSKILDNVYVATDDGRIYEAVTNFGGNAIMTSDRHNSGTDRCFEALCTIKRNYGYNFDIVINIQGDEPFINPLQIKSVMSCFSDKNTQIATLIKPIVSSDELFNPNIPKVVINTKNEAVFFSRSPLPYFRNAVPETWVNKHMYYRHIGLYAYLSDILKRITGLPQSRLEIAESLEQLRWIEN